MDDVSKKPGKIQEPAFKLNFATVVLLLVILIPLGYTIWVNLQDVMPNPKVSNDISPEQITKAPQSPQAQPAVNPADALVAALKAVSEKQDFQNYINLGLAYYAVDSIEAAIHSWQKAITYNSQSALTYNNIAAAYGRLNKFDDEIAACRKALAIDSNFTLAKNNLAWALSQKKGK